MRLKVITILTEEKNLSILKKKRHACDYLRNLKKHYWNSEFAHYRVNGQKVDNIDNLTDNEIIKGKIVFDNYVTFYIKEKYINFED